MVALRSRDFVPGALGHRSIVPAALGHWSKAAEAEAMVDIKDASKGEPAPTAPVNPGITSLSSSDLGAEVRVRTPGSSSSLRSLRTLAYSPSPRHAASRTTTSS